MKNIKTFEAFFSIGSTNQNSKDFIKLIGITQQTIEDLLIGFEDNFPDIHISIDFLNFYKNGNYEYINLKWVGGHPYNADNGKLIETVLVKLRFFPSGRLLDELYNKYKNVVSYLNNWYEIVVGNLDEDITDEIDQLKKRIELLGFYGFEFIKMDDKMLDEEIYSYLKMREEVESIKGNNNEVGYSIFDVYFKKDIILK